MKCLFLLCWPSGRCQSQYEAMTQVVSAPAEPIEAVDLSHNECTKFLVPNYAHMHQSNSHDEAETPCARPAAQSPGSHYRLLGAQLCFLFLHNSNTIFHKWRRKCLKISDDFEAAFKKNNLLCLLHINPDDLMFPAAGRRLGGK